MIDAISTSAGTIWTWLNAEQNAGSLSAVLAVLALVGGIVSWLWRRKSKAPTPDQTGGTHVSASTGGIGAGGSMTGNTITTNHGPTPDQIAAIFAGVRDLSQSSEAKAIAAADQFGTISREALTSFFTILRHEQVPPDQLTAKLTAIALQYREMVDRLTALEQTAGPDDRPTLAEVRIAIEKGDYDHADRLLFTLENAQADARAKAQANADDLARRQAATRAERARLSALRFDHRVAADHFLAAANLLPTGDTEEHSEYLTSSADALVKQGEERGDNSALHVAIARYCEAAPSRRRYSALWARVQNNLGNALSIVGERDGNKAYIIKAIDAYNKALLERTHNRTPSEWASTQNNLGTALRILGELESGPDSCTTLRKAADAYTNALLVWDQDSFSLSWAIIQNNLGSVFRSLGERECENDSCSLLRKAADAYTNALLIWTRDRTPLGWAATHNNLGNALSILGRREENCAIIQQAIDAFNSALLERTTEHLPVDWAMTQTNLGIAFRTLAVLTRHLQSARQAITAHEGALRMLTQLDSPYYIIVATNNLAIARATLARLESGADSAPHQ